MPALLIMKNMRMILLVLIFVLIEKRDLHGFANYMYYLFSGSFW